MVDKAVQLGAKFVQNPAVREGVKEGVKGLASLGVMATGIVAVVAAKNAAVAVGSKIPDAVDNSVKAIKNLVSSKPRRGRPPAKRKAAAKKKK